MQSKLDQRAIRPQARVTPGPDTQPARIRPDHATSHGRATSRVTGNRRASAQMQAQGGASMNYQMGFTSGPSN
jgi:hypothetical protein